MAARPFLVRTWLAATLASLPVIAGALAGCTTSHAPTATGRPQPRASTSPCGLLPHGGETRHVLLSDIEPQPHLALRVGDTLRALARNDNANVTAPSSSSTVLCRLRLDPPGRQRTAVFVAERPGRAYIGATITGVPGGINHPAYGARITVK